MIIVEKTPCAGGMKPPLKSVGPQYKPPPLPPPRLKVGLTGRSREVGYLKSRSWVEKGWAPLFYMIVFFSRDAGMSPNINNNPLNLCSIFLDTQRRFSSEGGTSLYTQPLG